MDRNGSEWITMVPTIIPIRPIFSDPPSFRCPTSDFSCVEILRGVQTFLRIVARSAGE
jgi:hypothetical protein